MSSVQVQSFCLRRKNHYSDMAEHFERMFKEESMVDVTLSCGDGSIKAHKMVLSACSTYFKNIFSKFTNPYQYPVVIIKDMPFEDLRAIIEFIYRGEVVVPQTQLSSILRSAEALRVKGLSDAKKRMDGEEGNVARKKKKRKKKRKTNLREEGSEHRSNEHQANDDDNENHENNGNSNDNHNDHDKEKDSTEEGSDYTDDDDDSNQSVTNITPVNQLDSGRSFTETNSNADGDIEPTRLLEQSMITGDERENGSVPRFPTPMNMPVTSIDPVINHEIKPMMFGETSGLIPQISLSSSITNTETSLSSSHNHLPTIPGTLPLTPFEAGALSIPGPSNISSVIPRSLHHSQGKGGYQCHQCLKRFDIRYSLFRHIRVIHDPSPQYHVCNGCGRRFAWKSAFLRHINVTCAKRKSKQNT